MATAVSAAVSLSSSSKSTTSLSTRSSIISSERISFSKVPFYYRNVSTSGRVISIRAQVTTEAVEAPAKVEKVSKNEVLPVLEWASKQASLIQDEKVGTLLAEAKGRLELYQSRGIRKFH